MNRKENLPRQPAEASRSWTAGEILDWTVDYFIRAGLADARIDAELLLAAVLGCTRLDIFLRRGDILTETQAARYRALIKERQQRKPVAYLLGEQEFMGLRFMVNEHTLIPRPETEHLVEDVIARLKVITGKPLVADIGTGSGAIAVSIAAALPSCRVYATDIHLPTLQAAHANAVLNGCAGRITFKQGNMLNALDHDGLESSFDVIVSNPPYIAHEEFALLSAELGFEPRRALDGGVDGMDFYRSLAAGGKSFLKPGGLLCIEISSLRAAATRALLEEHGYVVETTILDYAGHERVIRARKG